MHFSASRTDFEVAVIAVEQMRVAIYPDTMKKKKKMPNGYSMENSLSKSLLQLSKLTDCDIVRKPSTVARNLPACLRN